MPAAVFVLVRDGLALMEQRPDNDAYYPGEWLFPAGKFERGEGAERAMLREVWEELGVTPVDYERLDPPVEWVGKHLRNGAVTFDMQYPFVVWAWFGSLPDMILDSHCPLAWRPPTTALESQAAPCRAVARRVLLALANKAGSAT